jgi:hypothetical protein
MSKQMMNHIPRTWRFLLLAGIAAVVGGRTVAQECGWHQIEVAGPPARHSHAMVYDSAREVVVLFGGLNGGNSRDSVEFGDTWEWDGIQWRQVADTGPSPRMGHAMVYDSAKGVTVIFGRGSDTDTWEWDGITWTKVANRGPSARGRHGMAYDSIRGMTVLFGGIPRELGDLWEWDGIVWTKVAETGPPTGRSPSDVAYDPGPVGRSRLTMAYDPIRGVTVLFGGRLADGQALGDTWEWDGVAWTQVGDDDALARSRHAMVYDSDRGVMVVFGGMKGAQLKDTLEWDGAEWKQVATSGPPRRMYHSMAYDGARKTIVLFGGWDGTTLADTWEYRCPQEPPQQEIAETLEN